MNINDALNNVSSTARAVVGFGLSLVVVALVVDVLVPGTTNIVDKVAGLINSFIGHGLVGLVALIVFVSLANRN